MRRPETEEERLNAIYRESLYSRHRPGCGDYTCGEDVPMEAESARLSRTKDSHRGIGRRSALREFEAVAANQEFLEEVAQLTRLEYLWLEWPVTAIDLSPLRSLVELRHLTINSPRNITDFTPLLGLPKLERLFIENAKHMTNLEWLRPLSGQLKVLGIEGSLETSQRIPSLGPLEGFSLEALFLTSTRLNDQSFSPLKTMDSLKLLRTALNAPRAEFEALHAAQPKLQCLWFEPESWVNFRDPPPSKG